MKYFSFIFTVTFILVIQPNALFSQTDLKAEPPTLQVGLDGLSFTKGSLDAQLIMEIVAEKQQEVKIKAIQNIFLNKVANAGGTVYSFTDNVVRELVLEKDPKVRTKKILENTVNLVFVSAYLNFYLSSLQGDNKTKIIDLSKKFNCNPLDTSKTLTLASFIKKRRENSEKAFSDEDALNFITLLLDMSSEAVRNNAKLEQLGLMQISYSATYDYMNKYKKVLLDSCNCQTKCSDSLQIKCLTKKEAKGLNNKERKQWNSKKISLVENVNSIYTDMETVLSNVTDYIGLVNYLVSEYSFRNEKLELFSESLIPETIIKKYSEKTSDLKLIKLNIKTIIDSLSNKTINDSALISEINNLNRIYFYIEKSIQAINKNNVNPKTIADILYTFHSEFKPLLLNQSYRSVEYLNVISKLNGITSSFGELLLSQNGTFKELKQQIDPFILIASKLYQFDRSSTISEYLKLVEDIGYVFPDDNVKNALSTVITFVKDYTVIEENQKGNEVINFNVESFIVKLQNIKPYKLNRWQFNMTVGVNNAYFNKDLVLSDGSITRNLNYVGEKIGVKYKLIDRSFWMNRNPGETYLKKTLRHPLSGTSYIKTAPPREPLVSNIHTLIYGSGLLYNLVNTKSNKEFNMPLIGAGLGVTFYNALDFNVTYGVPIFSDSDFNKSFNNSFINVGFDIQFIEYYNRLQAKRSANKTQKKISQAQK